jgi:hypothetical protein
MLLVATPGAADANTYATLAEADSYHEGHVKSSAWAVPSGEKAQALVMAARILDAMPGAWTGVASSETQALGWPRVGMVNRNGFAIASGAVPSELKSAQAEFARQLLAEDTTESSVVVAQGITSIKAGPVALTFKQRADAYLALQQRDALNAMIPDAVRLLLVPSWLVDPREEQEEYLGLVVESL